MRRRLQAALTLAEHHSSFGFVHLLEAILGMLKSCIRSCSQIACLHVATGSMSCQGDCVMMLLVCAVWTSIQCPACAIQPEVQFQGLHGLLLLLLLHDKLMSDTSSLCHVKGTIRQDGMSAVTADAERRTLPFPSLPFPSLPFPSLPFPSLPFPFLFFSFLFFSFLFFSFLSFLSFLCMHRPVSAWLGCRPSTYGCSTAACWATSTSPPPRACPSSSAQPALPSPV